MHRRPLYILLPIDLAGFFVFFDQLGAIFKSALNGSEVIQLCQQRTLERLAGFLQDFFVWLVIFYILHETEYVVVTSKNAGINFRA